MLLSYFMFHPLATHSLALRGNSTQAQMDGPVSECQPVHLQFIILPKGLSGLAAWMKTNMGLWFWPFLFEKWGQTAPSACSLESYSLSVFFFLTVSLSLSPPPCPLWFPVPQAVVFINPGCNYFCFSLILLTFQLRGSSIRINPNRKKSHFTAFSYSSACCLQFQSN